MSRRRMTASTACLALLAMVSCSGPGSEGHPTRPARSLSGRAAAIRRTMHCASRSPTSDWRNLTAPTPGVRPDPVVAVICEYASRSGGRGSLTGQVTLGGRAAGGLAAVVDSAKPMQFQASSCGGDAPEHGHFEVILFGYQAGQGSSATVHQPTCNSQGNVLAGGGSFWLPWNVLDALLYPATDVSGNRGPRAPYLTGISLAAAAAAARRHGLALNLSGVITDTRVPFGSVLYQAVPPGTRSRGREEPSVRVIVAVRPAATCTLAQLGLTYRGNGARRGNDWGAIVISDVGEVPCRLPGSAQITGLDEAGRALTQTYTASITGPSSFLDPTTAPLVLSPRLNPIPDGLAAPYGFPPSPAGLAGAITLTGHYGPPHSRSCWVIPAVWRVVIGGLSRTVQNADPTGPNPIVPSGGYVTCKGNFSAALTYYGLLTY